MPNGDGYDDRRKKSWSEIDKMRDGKRSRGAGGAASDRERLERSAGYGRYKAAADAFFSGAALPDSLADKVDPTGEGRARKEALARLKGEEDAARFFAQAKAYVAEHGVFEDPYLLDRLLGHPEEAVVLSALGKIAELVEAGGFKAPKSLPERLKSIELKSQDDDVLLAAKRLGKRLREAP